jgi:hypothetical protein
MPDEKCIPPEWAAKIYDMLREECNAPPHLREDFIFEQGEGCREFRFQGGLGFGGKFYVSHSEWRVDCYTEDLNTTRRAMMRMANLRLANMRSGFMTQSQIASLTSQLAAVTRERDTIKEKARLFLMWFERDGEPVDGFRFREQWKQLNEAVGYEAWALQLTTPPASEVK